MIHEKKKQSLLSWVQSAGGHDVTSFSQLSDGKLLNELVVTLSDKDSDLSYKAEIEPKETSSDKPPRVSVGDEEQHELTKETVDSSIEKMESVGQEQEVVNGFHDSGSNELDSSGMFSCSDIKTEDVSENGNILESNSELMKEITAVCQTKAEDNDKQCISVDSCMGVSVNGSAKMDCSASQEDSNSVGNVDDSDVNDTADSAASEIQSRYNVVQRFIESMLELQCETLVNFPQCLERNELELAKLTILLLSAMVQYSLSTKKDHIMASCYSLSQEDQEEIMDCLEIFLKERQSPIELKEFHGRLSRRAKLRISPRKHCSSMSTPQFNKPTKRGRKRKAFNAVEEFLDKGFESPIQNLIQSPDIRHITPNSEARLLEAVRCKDKTIASLTYDLDMEKFTGDDLKKQNEDLSTQLSKLKKENKLLKEELSEIQANLENSELAFEKSQKDWKNEVKNYKRQIKDLKEAEKFWKESNQMEDTPKIQKIECTCSEEIGSLKCALQAKDDKIQEFQKQIEILNVQLDKLSQENKDLNSQLEENVNSDNKTSCGRLPTQEKCFNISDLSLRNELKDKCEELQNDLKQMEIEYSVNIRSLEELLSQKDKIEKECKAKLRKSDKEREDAINNQKKLEIENSNLKGQIEVFKNMLPEISSPLVPKSATASNSTPANRRSSRNRNACDSEKIGQLWQNYDDETEDVVIANISKTRLEPDETSCETITTEPPQSENRKVSEKSQNKLCRSQSVNNVTSTKNTCNICSQNDFCEVPPLIQNLCKIVREDNILDTDVLLELHKYERDFYMNDLVRVLTLLTRILLKDDGTCGRSLSKYRKDSGSLDLNSEITFEPISKINEPEQPRRRSVQGRRSGKSNQHSELDAGSSKSDKSLEKSNSIPFYRELLRREKRKVTCLQTKLKNLRNQLSSDEEAMTNLKTQLGKAERLRDTNVQRCRSLVSENELIRKELSTIKEKMHQEQSPPIIQNVIKTMPPPPCPKCPKLNEEIMSLRIALRDNEKLRDTLSSDLESRKVINEDLKRELRKLNDKNNELEESLSDPRIVSAGVYSPKLKTLCEKFRESLYKDIDSADTGSQEMLSNVSTVTNNCSFTVPSTSGFVTNNRNQSQLRAFCMAEDEAEMLSQSSISEMQSDTPNQRLKEINRRNTLCLPHLKSQYPLELNTTPSQHKYFRPPATPSCSKESSHLAKKRKISNASSVRSSFASLMSKPSTSGIKFHHSSTPKVKNFITKMHKTNTSAARLHFPRTSKDSTQK